MQNKEVLSKCYISFEMMSPPRESIWKLLARLKTLENQGRSKHLKLGGARHFEDTFFLRKRGYFPKMKRALLCLLQSLGGTCPQCPTPGSYVYVENPPPLEGYTTCGWTGVCRPVFKKLPPSNHRQLPFYPIL